MEHKLKIYIEYITFWKNKINLISKDLSTEDIQNHIKDCKEINSLLPLNSSILDIGSGAGFPGIITAIIRNDIRIHFSEINRKKCIFLRKIIQELNLDNAFVLEGCVSKVNVPFDTFTSRAMCDLSHLIKIVLNNTNQSNTQINPLCIFQKGEFLDKEIKKAMENFDFSYSITPGFTFKNRQIITLRDISLKKKV